MARNWIREAWDRMAKLPGGKTLFSRALGLYIPYTGSIGAQIEEARSGHARVSMTDRRAVRNHLDSVHAVALANLAELCGNLAIVYSMPADARFIVAGMNLEYVKKARGTITAICECPVPPTSEKREYLVPVVLTDLEGDVVVRATLRTLVGPIKKA